MMRRRWRNYLLILRNFLCFFIIILLLGVYNVKKIHDDQIKTRLSKSATKFIDFEEQNYENILQIETLKRLIDKYNHEELILNLDIYGSIKADAPVLVIFVDKYKINLKYFLASLQHVLGIADTLIIFSHSCFDENVNSLIKRIDFARVVQMFYPYSVQICPQKFPGYESGDCTRYLDIDTARSINCTGAVSPDIHGRYRDPLLSQKKHFWWWTVNTVFEKLSHTRNHKGIFIFIDDDVFLLEDLIFMTLQMKKMSEFISQCDIVSLSTSVDPDYSEKRTYGADISTWDPRQHSSVIAFDSQVWNSIAAHYYLFCDIDDYSWSRSLFYLSLNRKDGNRFKVISSTIPRAFKTPSNAYEPFLEYNILRTIYEILEMQKRNEGNFFPTQLEVYLNIELQYDEFINFDHVDNNGGWGDPRDKQMCANITENKIRKIILDMNSEFNNYKHDDDVLISDDEGEV